MASESALSFLSVTIVVKWMITVFKSRMCDFHFLVHAVTHTEHPKGIPLGPTCTRNRELSCFIHSAAEAELKMLFVSAQ